jgi:hypothetical protein
MVSADDTMELDPDDAAIVARFVDVLRDESTWMDMPPALGSSVAQAIADERNHLLAATAAGAPAPLPPPGVTAPALEPVPTPVPRRRLGTWIGVAAAAAVAALALGTLIGRSTGGVESDRQVVAAPTELEPAVDGTVGVRSVTSGVELRIDADGLPRRDGGEFYEGWLKSCDGSQLVPIGTFHTLDDVTAWAGVSVDDFPILTVTRESVAAPKDAAQGSSGEVVLTAQVGPDCPS